MSDTAARQNDLAAPHNRLAYYAAQYGTLDAPWYIRLAARMCGHRFSTVDFDGYFVMGHYWCGRLYILSVVKP